jgi:hypothetical protein
MPWTPDETPAGQHPPSRDTRKKGASCIRFSAFSSGPASCTCYFDDDQHGDRRLTIEGRSYMNQVLGLIILGLWLVHLFRVPPTKKKR